MTALNSGEARDPAVRRVVGGYAYKLAKEAGAKSWADLKARADAATYDAMLKIFSEQSAKHAARPATPRACAVSRRWPCR